MTRFIVLCLLFMVAMASFWLLPNPADKLYAAYAAIVVILCGVINVGPIK